MKIKPTILSILLTITIVNIHCMGQEIKTESGQQAGEQAVIQIPQGKVKANLVCMVDDKYFGENQMTVELDGKTYYGCCDPCMEYLQADKGIRYAKDPLTGKHVDKATACIVTEPGGNGKVLYFESEENYKQYLNK